MRLIDFLASTTGRWVRGVVGVILLVVGFVLGGTAGWVLGVLGVVFVAVGVFDVCLVAPLFGKPLRGRDIRSAAPSVRPTA